MDIVKRQQQARERMALAQATLEEVEGDGYPHPDIGVLIVMYWGQVAAYQAVLRSLGTTTEIAPEEELCEAIVDSFMKTYQKEMP